jgi:hypothetical protein
MDGTLYTFRQVATRLGVRRETVSDLVTSRRIPVVSHPNNGAAKAIDSEGLRQIEEALTPPSEVVEVAC